MNEAQPTWPVLKQVVAEALDLPDDAREAYLAGQLPDPKQRAKATRLLHACERAAASTFFGGPAAQFAAPILAEISEQDRGVPDAVRDALAGRYTIEHELGRGGMATVYLARDERHGRPVALKLLYRDLLSSASPSRADALFQREIQFAARLSHPHILPLYDSGAVGDVLYYIAPYVDGETLRERLRRTGRLPIPEAIRLLRDVTRALGHAHRLGVVHRDIKPANILLNKEGDALVADFGVARGLAAAQDSIGPSDPQLPSGEIALTDTADPRWIEYTDGGAILGTPAYMAPEQVPGGRGIDHRADLYALGAVAYEVLTGTSPFAGRPTQEQLAAHVSEMPEPISARRPDVPPPLAILVERLLSKRPDDRPRDADEVLRSLDAMMGAPDVAGTAPAEAGSTRSIAVLPFVPKSSVDAEGTLGEDLAEGALTESLTEGAFAVGLKDELVALLRRLPGLRVAAGPSAGPKSQNLDIRSIGEILSVETVLAGNVKQAGDRLRVEANLIRVGDSRVLWSDTFEMPADDLIALQERVARSVAAAVSPQAAGQPLSDRYGDRDGVDKETYELYLKGRHLVNTRQRTGIVRALEYFHQAIERNPDYARAHAGTADAWSYLAIFGHARPHDAMPKARAAAGRAIALDDGLVEAHAILAHTLFTYEWKWRAAESALKAAIAQGPRYPLVRLYYASFLHSVGRSEEGLTQLEIARELDPLIATGILAGRIYLQTHRPEEAIRLLSEEVELDPRLDLAHQLLGHAYLQIGKPDKAIDAMKRAAALSGPRDTAQLAYVYAKTGRVAKARSVLSQLQADAQPLEMLGYHLALPHVALNEPDAAFAWLEAAYRERGGFMTLLAVDPAFEPLRSDPRFDDLLQRVGLR